MAELLVLMYHALEDEKHPAGAKDPGEQRYVLPVSLFRQQMRHLCDKGYRSWFLEELQGLSELPEKSVVLTFDDGHESNELLALPILREFGLKAHFFVTTGWIGTPHFLRAEQLKRLCAAGMRIGSHGVTHRFLDDLPGEEAQRELRLSREVLERLTGERITTLSCPGGRRNKETLQLATAAGYRVVCSSEPAPVRCVAREGYVPRVAVTAQMSPERFALLLEGGVSRSAALRYKALLLLKSLLGNRLYCVLRKLAVS